MSEETKNGGPAFPCMPPQDMASGSAPGYPFPDSGMTLRDYFAAKAMQAMISCETDGTREQIAGWAYSQADAMLKERKADS